MIKVLHYNCILYWYFAWKVTKLLHQIFHIVWLFIDLIKGLNYNNNVINMFLIFNLKVMLYPRSPSFKFFSLVNLSRAQSTLWNLHVKQTLIGNSKINQIGCHCLTMTRFIPAANFLIMTIKQRTIDLVHTWQYM